MTGAEFTFIPDPKGLFLDVQYFGEDKPRYSIDIKKQRCTCKGFSIREKCKHFDRYLSTLESIIKKKIGD